MTTPSRRLARLALMIPMACLPALHGGCSAISSSFHEPSSDRTHLLVGSVTVDLFQYRGKTKTYREGVDVIIAARISSGGGVTHKNFWVKADERGYFMLSNVPAGDYAIRGFRIQTFGAPFFLTAVSTLNQPEPDYVIHTRGSIPSQGSHFDSERQDRVINLRHQYFIVDRGEAVHHTTLFRLDEVKTASGSLLMEPDVVTYFKEKHADSMWFKPVTAAQQ